MLNLGTLQFFLGVNTRALEAAKARIENFGRSVENTQRAANRGIANNINQMRKVENTSLKALETVNKMQAAIGKAKLAPNVKSSMLADLGRAYNDLTKGIIRAGQAADNTKLDRNFASFSNSVGQLNARLRETAVATRAAASSASAFSQQESRLAGMAEKARNLEAAMQRAAVSMPQAMGPALAQLSQQVDTAFARMQATMSGGKPLDPIAFRRAATTYNEAIGRIRREFQQLQTEAKAPAIADWQRFQGTMRNLGATALLLNGHLGGMSTRLFALGSLIGSLGIKAGLLAGAFAGAGMAVASMVGGALKAQLILEKVDRALVAITGSTAVAASQFKFLRDVAQQTGAGFQTLTGGYARYLAASKASGQTLQETQDQYRAIALATSTLALTVDDTSGVFRAFEQMLSKGQVQAEELRNQLGDRLPGAFAIAAKAMNVTTSELSKLTKEGKVLSADFVPKFIEAMKIAYNLKMDAPITTLQAALNRASDQVLYFFDAFNKNTRVVEAAKAALGLFTRGLGFLERNMSTIIQVMSMAARATISLALAWGVWVATAKVGALIGIVSALGRMIPLLVAARGWTLSWAAAQAALNALMVATPIGKVIGLAARLALVIGTAVVSYQQMDKWLGITDTAMNDAKGIREYIDQQKALGFQVRSVTQDLLRQATALAITATAKTNAAVADFKAAQEGPSMGDYAKSAAIKTAKGILPFGQVIPDISPTSFNKSRTAGLKQEMEDAAKQARIYSGLIRELQDVSTMKDETSMTGAMAGGKDDGKKGKKGAEDNISAIKNLINAYTLLQDKMTALSEGPDGLDKLDALNEAKQALDGLNANQLAKADVALKAAGLSTGTLQERMSGLVLATKQSEKAVDAFIDAWSDLDDVGKKMSVVRDQFDALAAGSALKGIEKFQDFADAAEMTKKLNPEGIQALAEKLVTLGVALDPATIGMDGLTKAVAMFFGQVRDGETSLDTLKDYAKEMADLQKKIQEANLAREGFSKGFKFEDGSLQMWVDQQMMIDHYRKGLEAAGLTAEEVTRKIAAMQGLMLQDAATEKFIEQARLLERFRQDVASSFAEAAGSIITSFGDIKAAAKNLMNDLIRLFTQRYITKPLFNWMDSMLSGSGLFKMATGGLVKAATGGYIRGPGTTTSDSIPSLLSDKEFVFSAQAVRRWGVPALQAMNSGKAPIGFSAGGAANDRGAANYNGGYSGYGSAGQQNVHVTIGVAPGDMFRPYVTSIATEQAIAITTTGLEEYNDRLPDRMQEISNDPRAR